MSLQQSILYVRIFSVLMLILSTYIIWVPSFSSLYKETGYVASVTHLISGRVTADFHLNSGVTVQCHGKSLISAYCRADRLQELQATHESLTIWHKNGKAWQVEAANGEMVIDYKAANHSGNMLLGVFWFVFGGIALFAPVLIRKP